MNAGSVPWFIHKHVTIFGPLRDQTNSGAMTHQQNKETDQIWKMDPGSGLQEETAATQT